MKRLRVKQDQKKRRKMRVRRKIVGTAERPRISVFKSNRNIVVQAVDDGTGYTLSQASTLSGNNRGLRVSVENGEKVGEELGNKLKSLGLEQAVYDRNGNQYHGVVKAVAEGVRKSGIRV